MYHFALNSFVVFTVLFSPLLFAQKHGPSFTKIVRTIEAEKFAGRVLYWNQTAADDLGIITAPGRPGQPNFEKSVLEQELLLANYSRSTIEVRLERFFC
jgi:hypothetical protein